MDDFPPIETERLILRRFRAGDLGDYLVYRTDPVVGRFQGWDEIDSDWARRFLARHAELAVGIPGKPLQIAIESRGAGRVIGDIMLSLDIDQPLQAEIGFSLAPEFQGEGFATEAVRALLGYAFGTLRLHRIVALVDPRNAPSIALLERIGMRREGHFRLNYWDRTEWTDEYLYALLDVEWQGQVEA